VTLKILIASGIWPPDVGGPASHCPEFGRFLLAQGHEIRAVTSAGPGGPEASGFPLTAWRRDRPRVIRMITGALTVGAAARWPDVVYSSGLYYKSVLASTLNRVPLVVKLTSDPAYERSRFLGLFDGDIGAFQQPYPRAAIRFLKLVRSTMLSRATHVVIPSRYLAEIALGWGLAADRVTVVPNPTPSVRQLPSREDLRRRLGINGATLAFAGRLVPAKNLPLAISALRHVPAARLVIIGDGPERQQVSDAIARSGLEARVVLKGALPRSEAIEWFRAADAALLSSTYENFPHAAVEALAAGTPVVATAVGGVPEVIETGINGILVPPGDERALADAMRSVTTDRELSRRLRDGAAATAGRYSADRAYEAIERELLAAARRDGHRDHVAARRASS
jgi:glycosyltransferase involved in cell wall biosynthesis